MLTRAYWESQAVPLPGGAYRVRPRGRWGAAHDVDEDAKDCIVRLQTFTCWLGLVSIVLAVSVLHRLDAAVTGPFALVLVGGIFTIHEVGLHVILRGRPSRPRGEAGIDASAVRQPRSPAMPRWFFRLLLSLYALLLVLTAIAMIPPALNGKWPPPSLTIGMVVLGAFALATWFMQRRL